MMKRALSSTAMTLALGVGAHAYAGQDLEAIKSRGEVICGISTGVAGFSIADSSGKYTGLDVDTCRAISAAVFGSPDKTRFVALSTAQRFTALQSGEVDVLTRNTTWSLTREAQLGFLFGPVVYYDGQGFMVKKSLGIKSAKQLSGASVCVEPGTTTELNLADYFRTNKMELKPVVIDNLDEVENAFFAGRCDAFTTDSSALASNRLTRAPKPDDYIILPELISKEPLAPAVRQGDDQFYDIMRWSVYALLQAEEKGITSKNVDDMLKSENPSIKRILGVTPGMGKALGVDEKWVYNIIKQVGNYGESYDRHVGPESLLKIDRGVNKLWTQGGLQYAPPIR